MGKPSIARSAGLVSACTLLSRLLGLTRDILCSRFLGAGMEMSAFALASMIPNLFRRLFGEGALSAAFVPAINPNEARSQPNPFGRSRMPLRRRRRPRFAELIERLARRLEFVRPG